MKTVASARQWVILLVLALIWGSSFILIKRGLFTPEGIPVFSGPQVGGLRILIAAIFLSPLAFRHIKLLKSRRNLVLFFLVGLCGNALPAILFGTAQTEVPSSLTGMFNSTVPLFSLIIARFVFKVKVMPWQVGGLFLGLFAVVALLYSSSGSINSGFNPWYLGLILLATICYAINLNIVRQFLMKESSVAITSVALLLVSPIGIAVLAGSGFLETVQTVPGAWASLGAVSVLAILGTAIALLLFNKLVQDTNTIFASTVTYLIPIVAIAWGVMDGESFNLIQFVCILGMLAGILLINKK